MIADFLVRDASFTNQSDKLVHRRMKYEAEQNLRELANSWVFISCPFFVTDCTENIPQDVFTHLLKTHT